MRQVIKRIAPALHLVFAMASRASNQIVALLVTLVAATRLSPTGFGVFALASALIMIVRTLLYSTTFQYVLKAADLRACSTECLIVSMAMAGVVTLAMTALLLATDLFGDPAVFWLFALLIPSNLISAVVAWQEAQILRTRGITRYYAVTGGIEVATGIVTIMLLFLHLGVMALVIQIYLRAIALLAAYRLLQRPVLSVTTSFARTIEIGRWALPQYASMIAGLVSNYGGDFVIGAILSPAATGIYRAASRFTGAAADICGQPLRTIAMTSFSRQAARGETAGESLPRMIGLALLLIGTALGGMAAVAGPVMPLLLGAKWAGIEHIIMILCIGRGAAALSSVVTPMLVAFGRHRVLLPVQTIAAAVLLAGLLLVAHRGLLATAWMTSAALVLACLIYLAIAFRLAPPAPGAVTRSLRAALLPAAASTLAAAAMLRFAPPALHGGARPVVAIMAAVLAWAAALWVERRSVAPLLSAVRHEPLAAE